MSIIQEMYNYRNLCMDVIIKHMQKHNNKLLYHTKDKCDVIKCVICGGTYTRSNKTKHELTSKHSNYYEYICLYRDSKLKYIKKDNMEKKYIKYESYNDKNSHYLKYINEINAHLLGYSDEILKIILHKLQKPYDLQSLNLGYGYCLLCNQNFEGDKCNHVNTKEHKKLIKELYDTTIFLKNGVEH